MLIAQLACTAFILENMPWPRAAGFEWRSRHLLHKMCSDSRCSPGNGDRQIAHTTRHQRLVVAQRAQRAPPSLLPKYTGQGSGRQAFHSMEAGCLIRGNDETRAFTTHSTGTRRLGHSPASSIMVGKRSTRDDSADTRRPVQSWRHGARTMRGTRVPCSNSVNFSHRACSPREYP